MASDKHLTFSSRNFACKISGIHFFVIARSISDEAIHFKLPMDCRGVLGIPSNDGVCFVTSEPRIKSRVTKPFITSCLAMMLFFPIITVAHPWLPEEGTWKYYLGFSHHHNPYVHQEREAYFGIESQIAKLYNHLSKIKHHVRIVQFNKGVTNGDVPKIDVMLNNRIREINENISNLKLLQQNLVWNPVVWESSGEIEYGAGEYYSYGILGNLHQLKYSEKNADFGIFAKYKLYGKKHKIFTVQPKVILGNNVRGVGITAMLGESKKSKTKLGNFDIEIFKYFSAGVNRYSLRDCSSQKMEYQSEISGGIKFEGNIIIMLKAMHILNPGDKKIYNSLLRKELLLAGNITPNNPRKIYLSLGYFTLDSLRIRRNIATGYSAGLWITV